MVKHLNSTNNGLIVPILGKNLFLIIYDKNDIQYSFVALCSGNTTFGNINRKAYDIYIIVVII